MQNNDENEKRTTGWDSDFDMGQGLLPEERAAAAGLTRGTKIFLGVLLALLVTTIVCICRTGSTKPHPPVVTEKTEQAETLLGNEEVVQAPEYQDFDAHLRVIEEYLFRIAKANERLSPMPTAEREQVMKAREASDNRDEAMMRLMEEIVRQANAEFDSTQTPVEHNPLKP